MGGDKLCKTQNEKEFPIGETNLNAFVNPNINGTKFFYWLNIQSVDNVAITQTSTHGICSKVFIIPTHA